MMVLSVPPFAVLLSEDKGGSNTEPLDSILHIYADVTCLPSVTVGRVEEGRRSWLCLGGFSVCSKANRVSLGVRMCKPYSAHQSTIVKSVPFIWHSLRTPSISFFSGNRSLAPPAPRSPSWVSAVVGGVSLLPTKQKVKRPVIGSGGGGSFVAIDSFFISKRKLWWATDAWHKVVVEVPLQAVDDSLRVSRILLAWPTSPKRKRS